MMLVVVSVKAGVSASRHLNRERLMAGALRQPRLGRSQRDWGRRCVSVEGLFECWWVMCLCVLLTVVVIVGSLRVAPGPPSAL